MLCRSSLIFFRKSDGESAVFAVPSELSEDDVKAVVVLKKGGKISRRN